MGCAGVDSLAARGDVDCVADEVCSMWEEDDFLAGGFANNMLKVDGTILRVSLEVRELQEGKLEHLLVRYTVSFDWEATNTLDIHNL